MNVNSILRETWGKNEDAATHKKVGDNGGGHVQFWRNDFKLDFELKRLGALKTLAEFEKRQSML